MVHSHLHLVSWLLINFVRIVSKSNANGFPLKISMNAHEKKTRIARILEMIWIMLLVIDWKSRFGIAPVANVGLYFKEFLIYSGCRWLRLNWFPAIDLHLAQIILSYSIELANKLKQIGYLSFWQTFSTNENPNPFNVQRCMEYGERNSMQKCFDCAVWVIWVSNNIRILIEHN